jgi:hypothetical protein
MMVVPEYMNAMVKALEDREPRGQCPLCGESFFLMELSTRADQDTQTWLVASAEVMCVRSHRFVLTDRANR